MKWTIGILAVLTILVVSNIISYRCGNQDGIIEGRTSERERWEWAAHKAPFLREPKPGHFFYVRTWNGKKPLPDIPVLE